MNPPPGPRSRARPTALAMAYPVLRRFFRAKGWETLRTRPAILVYQMAKVGSKSVVRSIRAAQPGRPVFHIHTLTDQGIAATEKFYRWSRVPSLPGAGHLLVSRYLKEQLRQGVTPGRWKIITLVRDPVARNISLLFQLGPRLLPDIKERCNEGRLDPLAVFDQFVTAFPAQVDCMRWFRDELQPVFGVDPFSTPFDREAGYQVYHGSFADVLLIKTECLDRSGETAFRSFLGLERLCLRRANIGAQKALGAQYTDLLDKLMLPRSFVDRYYNTPEVRHFYSPDELDRARLRWCGARGGSS